MKKILLSFFVFVILVSCKQEEELVPESMSKPIPVVEQFGFKYNDFTVSNDTVRSGDTFGSILGNQNLGDKRVYDITEKVKDSFDVRIMRIGKPYTIFRTKDRFQKIQAFVYQPDRGTYYVIDFRDSIHVYKKTRPITIKTRTIAGALDGSFSEALQKQKVDVSLAGKITKIYAWSIDFFKLKKGDKFGVTFTERYIDDTIYDGVDSLKAAFFEYKGKKIYAFPFEQKIGSGKQEYFDENGKTLKNFFLKAPLKFVNITSRFAKSRFHPVQLIWKAHKGTDYAAPTGTPVKATASGIIAFSGSQKGYGNLVVLKHNGKYETAYGHLSRFASGMGKGKRVNQGDVIGYVGATGMATGPHLHYELRVDGVQRDPTKVVLPTAPPIAKRDLNKFQKETQSMVARLNIMRSIHLAALE